MGQLLILFIAIPLLAFFATLLRQNKSERAIGKIVQFAKVFNILIAVSFVVWWLVNGIEPISHKLVTLYQTEHFVFAIQLYYNKAPTMLNTAVISS